MASPTVKIVKMKKVVDGETSATSGSFAKAVSDAIGNTTAALTQVCVSKEGQYQVATILIFAA